MTELKRGARTAIFADMLAARLDIDLSERERAAISQLVYELTDDVSCDLPPEPQSVTVLMVDLRGFSALAASVAPETLVALLQPFFTSMTEVIHDHGGFVDKFLGDGVMALFGAPAPCADHLHRALSCAVQMQCAMSKLNARNKPLQLPPLYAGIGINSGEVMAGSFGSQDYHEYTVIGDEVNLAARMEKFALRGEVLISEHCFRAAKDMIEVADTRHPRVRGHNGPITLHKLGAVTRPLRIEVPNVETRASPRVPVNLPLRYSTIEDQRVLQQERKGSIINLGYHGMLAQLPQRLPEHGEITFGLAPEPTAMEYEDVFARALHQHPTDNGFQTAFAFTSVGARGSEAVRRYVDQALWGA